MTDLNIIKNKINYSGERQLSKEERDSILKKRALALSKERVKTDDSVKYIRIMEFALGTETYAIESEFVIEVCPLKDFTVLPHTPAFLCGVVNIRGRILSIIDLKKLLNLPAKGLGRLDKIIIIKNESLEIGILADSIGSISSIPVEAIQESPLTVSEIGAEYLKGVTKEHIIVLSADKILKDPKIIIDQVNK